MTRPERIAQFRGATAGKGGWLVTSLRIVGSHNAADAGAIRNWISTAPSRRPVCFGCANQFSPENKAAAFLTARSSRTNAGVAVSGICRTCWDTMTPDAVEQAAAEVLRRNLCPHGKFLD
jgi:hypothetical protein